jgi:hypothetical protein
MFPNVFLVRSRNPSRSTLNRLNEFVLGHFNNATEHPASAAARSAVRCKL